MNTLDRLNGFVRRSATLKLIGVAILALILLIPASMIDSLVYERQNLRDAAVAEIASKWGNVQRLAGPVIQVPYTQAVELSDGKVTTRRGSAYFLPEEVTFDGGVASEERYRGIYVAVLYTSTFQVRGRFSSLDLNRIDVNEDELDWSRARLCFGVEDLRGIDSLSKLQFSGASVDFEPGAVAGGLLSSGFQAPIQLDSGFAGGNFEFDVTVRGNSAINFTPLAANTVVDLNSDWGTPKFSGAFLPDERDIDDAGFMASWRVLEVNRPFPQQGTLLLGQDGLQPQYSGAPAQSAYEMEYRDPYQYEDQSSFNGYDFGVNFLLPVDDYRKTMRSAKYSALFIAATFLTFFFIEVLNGRRLHPVQYLLVGFAVVLFYVLLLSLSEHLGFDWAYLIAALLILGLVTGYSAAVLRNTKLTLLVAGVLAALYAFFYSLLQLEDYSLLIGSFGLLAALATIMYLTRRTNWYQLQTGEVAGVEKS